MSVAAYRRLPKNEQLGWRLFFSEQRRLEDLAIKAARDAEERKKVEAALPKPGEVLDAHGRRAMSRGR